MCLARVQRQECRKFCNFVLLKISSVAPKAEVRMARLPYLR